MNESFKNRLRRAKRLMENAGGAMVENAAFQKIAIEGAATSESVRDLIAKLRAKKTERPLIRSGSLGDGGYLVPDDFEGIVGCVSPGVAGEVGFDLEMADRGMRVAMADASVDGPPMDHPNFTFTKKFLGTHNDGQTIRLDDFVQHSFANGDLVLQMDIEGAEFPVLLDCSDETLARFRIIVLEVHDFGRVFGKFSRGLISAFVDKVTRSHEVVHIHPNNCCGSVKRKGIEIPRVLEFTLLRKDRGVLPELAMSPNPHPLDTDNVPDRAPLRLPQIWISD